MTFYGRGSIKQFFGDDPTMKLYLPLQGSPTDESGNGYHMSEQGTPTRRTGLFDVGVYDFNGTNQYLDRATNILPAIAAGDFTITFWSYADVINNDDAIIYQLNTTPNRGIFVYHSDTGNAFAVAIFGAGGTYVLKGATTIVAGRWYHVVVTREGTNVRIYVNGILYTSGTDTGGDVSGGTDSNFFIGIDRIGNGDMNGTIQEVAVFYRAWSMAEVSAYYNWATNKNENDEDLYAQFVQGPIEVTWTTTHTNVLYSYKQNVPASPPDIVISRSA